MLTKTQKAKLSEIEFELRAVQKNLAKYNLLDFCKFNFPKFPTQYKHIQLIASKLEAVERGEIKRLMIFAPPRHYKSWTVTVNFPAYFSGRNPNKRVIEVSYASQLIQAWSRRTRNIMIGQDYQDMFGVRPSPDSHAKDAWDLQIKEGEEWKDVYGGLIAAGFDGTITGFGANLFIIDDPFKNRKEAKSLLIRNNVWDGYRDVVSTRLASDGAIVLIMTRWDKDDLAGRLITQMEEGGEQWEIVSLPAIAEEDDLLGRKVGEALCPEEFNEERLEEIKQVLSDKEGARTWWSLYQQKPRDEGSKMIKKPWIRWYSVLPPIEGWYAGIDTATSQKTSGHDSAIVDGGRSAEGHIYVDDVVKGQFSVKGLATEVITDYNAKRHKRITIELNNAGDAIKQRMDEMAKVERLLIPLVGETASTDKAARLLPFTPLIENGTILFNMSNPKVVDLVKHLCDFEAGDDYDDIDAFVWMLRAVEGGSVKKYGGGKTSSKSMR